MTGPPTALYYLLCAVSGCVWAGIAWLIGHKGFGSFLWGGIVASPLIGVIVGLIYRPAYRLSTTKRAWLSLLTLYMAVTLFGLAIAVFDLAFGDPARGHMEGILQTTLAVWWGVTLTGYVVVLWPLAYLNHWLLGSMLDLHRA
jgi:hypothetical protein